MVVCVACGMLTSTFGGVIRDVLCSVSVMRLQSFMLHSTVRWRVLTSRTKLMFYASGAVLRLDICRRSDFANGAVVPANEESPPRMCASYQRFVAYHCMSKRLTGSFFLLE